MGSIRLKIVTPEKIVFEETVEQVSLPTARGMITILPHHAPVMSLVTAGELAMKKGSTLSHLAVSSGFVQVHDNEVVILADTAEPAENIDIERAQARALQIMQEMKNTDEVNYVALAAKMEKELARLRVAKKRKAPHSAIPRE